MTKKILAVLTAAAMVIGLAWTVRGADIEQARWAELRAALAAASAAHPPDLAAARCYAALIADRSSWEQRQTLSPAVRDGCQDFAMRYVAVIMSLLKDLTGALPTTLPERKKLP